MNAFGRVAASVATLSLIAGCAAGAGTSATLTPSPSVNPAATASPHDSVAPATSPSHVLPETPEPPVMADSIEPDTVVEVAVTDLVIRSAPGTADASTILEPRLSQPQLLYVADGPVLADGYEWYLVQMFWMDHLPHGPEVGGWVAAASRDGETWIVPTALDCPTPTLDALAAMREVARLACYGGQTLTLEGNDGGCFQADPVSVSPGWLTHSGCSVNPDGYVEGVVPGSGRLVLRQGPGIVWEGYTPGTTGRTIVTGHFDDPAARTCRAVEGFDVSIPELLVLSCRAQFVAEEIRAAS